MMLCITEVDMEQAKKKRIKKYISWICLASLVVVLTAMPLLAAETEETDGPTASILSGTVETGSIETTLQGGGTLASDSSVDVTIPSGVKITRFLVENGDVVTKGTALAAIDRISVMSAITQVQDTMEYLVEEMNDVTDETVSDTITAQAGGRVKMIYGQEGENVQDVMLRDGALAVLSLDGLMAVQIERYTDLTTGDIVCVTLADDTEVTGRVESNLNGILIVTIDDEGYAIGEKVKVTTEDGDRIGSGELYVHNAWKAAAYSGTISRVNISEETTVSAGASLFTLKDTAYTAQLNSLANQHRAYEALMLELFQMYQEEAINAPCDGMVSGIDEDSAHLLSDTGASWILSFLTNAPNGDDETVYTNFVGMVTGLDSGNWNLALNPTPLSITDYKDLSGIPLDTAAMTQIASYVPNAPIYELVNGEWQQIDAASITAGDILLFAGDADGAFVWTVRIAKAAPSPEEPSPSEPVTPPTESADPTEPSESPSESTESTEPGSPIEHPEEGAQQDSIQSDGIHTETLTPESGTAGGFSGGMGGYTGGAAQEEEFELFNLEGSTLMTVTSQASMTLTISIDEQDIAKISMGQTAQIQVDALKNETFTATVTSIGTSGTSNGGSSKFTVELTMDKAENMLSGMSATASIPLSTAENILTIPVAALVEDGAETVVYTSYDESTGSLMDPVAVTVGISDGTNAEILSGLTAGSIYYYAYYDTLELSTKVESTGFSFGK